MVYFIQMYIEIKNPYMYGTKDCQGKDSDFHPIQNSHVKYFCSVLNNCVCKITVLFLFLVIGNVAKILVCYKVSDSYIQ